jgi:DNA invertase Pin-like site-specific DNA recombinase
MSDFHRLGTIWAPDPEARKDAVYTRTAADDEGGTACRDQVGRTLEVLGTPAGATVYADARRSGLDADRPALRHLLPDARRGGLRRLVVRDLARLARSAAPLEPILGELRAADVELLTVEGAKRHA